MSAPALPISWSLPVALLPAPPPPDIKAAGSWLRSCAPFTAAIRRQNKPLIEAVGYLVRFHL
ncbi:hypothetical protein ACP4OV_027609 [Aristida adscensionis]